MHLVGWGAQNKTLSRLYMSASRHNNAFQARSRTHLVHGSTHCLPRQRSVCIFAVDKLKMDLSLPPLAAPVDRARASYTARIQPPGCSVRFSDAVAFRPHTAPVCGLLFCVVAKREMRD